MNGSNLAYKEPEVQQDQAELVTTERFKWSDLWLQDDWQAVWIGMLVILVGAVAVITGGFDFSAASFSTWGNGVSLSDQLTGALAVKLLRTFLVLGVLFAVGNKLKGTSLKKFIPAFVGLFVLAVLVRLISAEYTFNRYLEWAFFAIALGLLVSNTVGVPDWLKPAVQSEYYN
jgi:hypothetical protein